MKVIFCEHPLQARQVDDDYQAEAAAAAEAGLTHGVINFEALVHDGDATRAVKRVPQQLEPTLGVYRGWMLRPARYEELYVALETKGIRLINDPDAYRHGHHLPESFAAIADASPESVWLPVHGEVDFDQVMALLALFGEQPVIVKDYVKSQKHYWLEACFIPSAADRAAVERVVRRFLELQGDQLNEGLVFRRFVPLQALTLHSRSGMPLSREFRAFVLDGEVLHVEKYWDEGDYAGEEPPLDLFRAQIAKVQSRFFTLDVVQGADGQWLIVELGDGQVAGLPDRADTRAFYRSLADRLHSRP